MMIFGNLWHFLKLQTLNRIFPQKSSEMDKLQGFQNKFAKKVLRENVSSKEALKTLKWLPLECRRRGHRCELVQNAIKGN